MDQDKESDGHLFVMKMFRRVIIILSGAATFTVIWSLCSTKHVHFIILAQQHYLKSVLSLLAERSVVTLMRQGTTASPVYYTKPAQPTVAHHHCDLHQKVTISHLGSRQSAPKFFLLSSLPDLRTSATVPKTIKARLKKLVRTSKIKQNTWQ